MNEQLLISSFDNLDTTSAGLGAVFGILAGIGMAMLIFYLILLVLTIIAMWRIFTKAGEKGWKSLIPFYNVYVLFRIAGRSFWKYLWIVIALGVVEGLAKSITNSVILITLGILSIALSIWVIIEVVKLNHGLSKNFGHGAGFTVGLFFLNTIFMLILGLGSSEYQGNNN